jgi:hypothetical protein
MVECIVFIIKTEVLLPPKQAMRVRVSSFINPKGKKGKNIVADMQKENQEKGDEGFDKWRPWIK